MFTLRAVEVDMAVTLTIAESGETGGRNKREKFVALAESRTVNAIKAIRVISKLGNKSAYDFTEADVNKIAKALTKEIDAMKARMLSTKTKEDVDFNL
jgi:ribosomal protein L7/L12